jgi:hypothetical protein
MLFAQSEDEKRAGLGNGESAAVRNWENSSAPPRSVIPIKVTHNLNLVLARRGEPQQLRSRSCFAGGQQRMSFVPAGICYAKAFPVTLLPHGGMERGNCRLMIADDARGFGLKLGKADEPWALRLRCSQVTPVSHGPSFRLGERVRGSPTVGIDWSGVETVWHDMLLTIAVEDPDMPR